MQGCAARTPPRTPPRRRARPTFREEEQARAKRRRACTYAATIAPELPRTNLDLCDFNNRWKQIDDFKTPEELNAFYEEKRWPWRDLQVSPEGGACRPPPRRRLPKNMADIALQNLRLDDDAWMGDTLWDTNFNPPDSQSGFYGGLQFSELCFKDLSHLFDGGEPHSSSHSGATKK